VRERKLVNMGENGEAEEARREEPIAERRGRTRISLVKAKNS
jgi:hypothetical protein